MNKIIEVVKFIINIFGEYVKVSFWGQGILLCLDVGLMMWGIDIPHSMWFAGAQIAITLWYLSIVVFVTIMTIIKKCGFWIKFRKPWTVTKVEPEFKFKRQ